MGSSLIVKAKQYEIYVTIIAGEGDGDLIYRDANGRIHHIGPDPGPLTEKINASIKNIEAGVAQFAAAAQGIKAQ
jgi:hypothetical protein